MGRTSGGRVRVCVCGRKARENRANARARAQFFEEGGKIGTSYLIGACFKFEMVVFLGTRIPSSPFDFKVVDGVIHSRTVQNLKFITICKLCFYKRKTLFFIDAF